MARLVWDSSVEAVVMKAEDGEELNVALVAAWGQARAARELMNIAHWIEEIRDTLEHARSN